MSLEENLEGVKDVTGTKGDSMNNQVQSKKTPVTTVVLVIVVLVATGISVFK